MYSLFGVDRDRNVITNGNHVKILEKATLALEILREFETLAVSTKKVP
jgi:hypothetical protein